MTNEYSIALISDQFPILTTSTALKLQLYYNFADNSNKRIEVLNRISTFDD